MKIFITVLMTTSIFVLPASALSWFSVAHRIIAEIAYQRLNPRVKQTINRITKVMFKSRLANKRFLMASIWPDVIKYDDVAAFNSWHFIDIPYSAEGIATKPIAKENVAWAIQQSIAVLASPRANLREKALFLTFLIHFVGDVHQPLHCVNRYSRTFPNGDNGGNLFPIRSAYANNLHAYWDGGLGLFHKAYRLRSRSIVKWAHQIARQYPASYFGNQVKDRDPWHWARESYQIDKKTVYHIQPDSKPSNSYVKLGRSIVRKQVALAGYRLAYVLNHEPRGKPRGNTAQSKLGNHFNKAAHD